MCRSGALSSRCGASVVHATPNRSGPRAPNLTMFTDFAGPSWLVGYGVIGSTTDSGSVGLGSSPGTPANITIPFSRTRKAGQSGVGSRQSRGLFRSLSQSPNYDNLTAQNLIDPRRDPDSSHSPPPLSHRVPLPPPVPQTPPRL